MSAAGECVVVGMGPVGLTALLALAFRGEQVVGVGPLPTATSGARDTRTTALFPGSVNLLQALGIWREIAERAAPLAAIRIIDATGSLWRAPETLFRASDIGLPDFGANIANADLTRALLDGSRHNARVCLRDAQVSRVGTGRDRNLLALSDGSDLDARLTVAADGRNSACREAAGIATSAWSYPQAAIATTFAHRLPHESVSTEFHRSAGPLTTVPMPGQRSSLVWVDTPAAVEHLMALADEAFARELEDNLQGLLGLIGDIGPRATFPLSGMRAGRMGQRRTALVGEAGHVLPPIGAQGLNLGLRDVAALADCVADARRSGEDVGGDEALRKYDDMRRLDVATRTVGVDLLNRSLIAAFLPLEMLRGAGLHLLNIWPQLRHEVMREGLQPGVFTPSMMRGPDTPGAV